MDTSQIAAGGRPAEPGAPGTGSPEEVARFVVGAAVHAPSVHNTQPWRFSHREQEISVHADPERRLRVADPSGREMMISCGAALFTVRLALRYLGFVPEVRVLPDPDRPNLVARVTWAEQVPPADYERQLHAEIRQRRTHRGGFDPAPLPVNLIATLRHEAAREKAMLRIVAEDGQRNTLAAIVQAADFALRLDSTRAREEARWALPPDSPRRDGVPATAYPAQPERMEPHFPARDFAHGHGWGLPPQGQGPMPRSAGVVGILTTGADEPADWVHAGQALQRVLLLASSCGVAAALHSQPLELPELRAFVAAQLCGGAHPQMVLRLGATGEVAVSVRRPVDEVLL